MDLFYSVILRYVRSEVILRAHKLICKILSYNAMAVCDSFYIAIRLF